METILYTTTEIDLLCQSLTNSFDEFMAEDIRKAITGLISFERVLYRRHLNADESWELRCREPLGESRLFVLLYNQGGHLDFEFCTRHLRNFLYRTELVEMPLLLNTRFISIIASWRLQIAK